MKTADGGTAGVSGTILLQSGDTSAGVTGGLDLKSGAATGGSSGDIGITTGAATTTSRMLLLRLAFLPPVPLLRPILLAS